MPKEGPQDIGAILAHMLRDPSILRKVSPDPDFRHKVRQALSPPSKRLPEEAGELIRERVMSVVFADDRAAESRQMLAELDPAFADMEDALKGNRAAVLNVADALERWGYTKEKNAFLGALGKVS